VTLVPAALTSSENTKEGFENVCSDPITAFNNNVNTAMVERDDLFLQRTCYVVTLWELPDE